MTETLEKRENVYFCAIVYMYTWKCFAKEPKSQDWLSDILGSVILCTLKTKQKHIFLAFLMSNFGGHRVFVSHSARTLPVF